MEANKTLQWHISVLEYRLIEAEQKLDEVGSMRYEMEIQSTKKDV